MYKIILGEGIGFFNNSQYVYNYYINCDRNKKMSKIYGLNV